jgi:hypothetical protein
MKLIYCTECRDLVSLTLGTPRKCQCLHAGGHYTDPLHAVYWGTALPVGLDNRSFLEAVKRQPRAGMGEPFNAFIIPRKCPTFQFLPEEP